MKREKGKSLRIYNVFLLFSVFLLMAGETQAEGVQARYLENSGKVTVLELTIEAPAPSSVIVQQQLPPGTRIHNAAPAYTKFNPGKAEVKWLFKRPRPGVRTITLHYDAPLSGKGASAVIRCKSPTSGQLMTITVP
ncbi:MAG: hypothetical protein KKD01_05260 [Proteobacteria bacterium]|nr:hypothetical protein [Pseudomonadota bacterium]MBU1234486.1 hypothetical protein [Pseudomonadota bacterium]MBU1417298.1 hypothetical protein [Pseudomonadota bacterium]MBU1454117.1 hypothetical protein [Pseudomonadota bacterium]